VAEALRDASAALTQAIWVELWGGARNQREDDFLNGIKESCQWLNFDHECWERSYALQKKAIRGGLNCPLADVLIVACAQRYGAELFHSDKHMTALLKL